MAYTFTRITRSPQREMIHMQYDVKTPTEYMNALADDWRREKLQALRNLIKKNAPDLTEGINYKMLSYSTNSGPVFHLNAQKNYVSLYVGNIEKVDPDKKLLTGVDIGKGCIRFKKTTNIDTMNISTFIRTALTLVKQGKDIDC